jgi:hypothetical protein
MYFRTRVQIPAPPFITSLGRVPFYFPALAARSRPAFGWLPPGARLLFVSVGAAPLHSPPRCALAASLRPAPLRRSFAPCQCRWRLHDRLPDFPEATVVENTESAVAIVA